MKRDEQHINHYHHYVADPLFYKVRPFALVFLLLVLLFAMGLTAYALIVGF